MGGLYSPAPWPRIASKPSDLGPSGLATRAVDGWYYNNTGTPIVVVVRLESPSATTTQVLAVTLAVGPNDTTADAWDEDLISIIKPTTIGAEKVQVSVDTVVPPGMGYGVLQIGGSNTPTIVSWREYTA